MTLSEMKQLRERSCKVVRITPRLIRKPTGSAHMWPATMKKIFSDVRDSGMTEKIFFIVVGWVV